MQRIRTSFIGVLLVASPALAADGQVGPGEFWVGVVGLFVSIVGLIVAVLHNTRALRASTYNAMVSTSFSLYHPLYGDENGFAELFARQATDGGPRRPLTDIEKWRWHFFMVATFRHFDNLLYQGRRETLDRDMLATYRHSMAVYARMPAYASWFKQHPQMFSAELRRFMRDEGC